MKDSLPGLFYLTLHPESKLVGGFVFLEENAYLSELFELSLKR